MGFLFLIPILARQNLVVKSTIRKLLTGCYSFFQIQICKPLLVFQIMLKLKLKINFQKSYITKNTHPWVLYQYMKVAMVFVQLSQTLQKFFLTKQTFSELTAVICIKFRIPLKYCDCFQKSETIERIKASKTLDMKHLLQTIFM